MGIEFGLVRASIGVVSELAPCGSTNEPMGDDMRSFCGAFGPSRLRSNDSKPMQRIKMVRLLPQDVAVSALGVGKLSLLVQG